MTYDICDSVRVESRVSHLFTARMENGEYPYSHAGTLCGERHNHRAFLGDEHDV